MVRRSSSDHFGESMGALLDRMEPLLAAMPSVKSPEGHVHFKTKLFWTLGVLVLYFILSNILIFGLDRSSQDIFLYWRALLAGQSGTIIHLGIGPIVTASIVLQLLKGADLLQISTRARPGGRSSTWGSRSSSSSS